MQPFLKNRFYRLPGKKVGYIRNLKCGSTFFSNIFLANGWVESPLDSIDWNHDHIFSFIMDPYVRHIKGLVEDAINMGIEKIMLQNFGLKFWQDLPWIGPHSMPMSIIFGDSIHKIDWIPIDLDTVSSESVVDKILSSHEIKIDWTIPVYRNESIDYKKQLFHKFSSLANSEQKRILLEKFCADYEIYSNALSRYSSI